MKAIRQKAQEEHERQLKELEMKLKAINEKYRNVEEMRIRKIHDVCIEFGINPEKVFDV